MNPAFERRLVESATTGAPPELVAAVTHLLDAGGKRVRPALVLDFGALCGAEPDPLTEFALAVEMLHAATLVHDDLIDGTETRRGRPTVHAAFGRDVAILVGDLYVARCGVHCAATGWSGAGEELFGALSRMVAGELAQRGQRFNLAQTQAAYAETISRKTSSLLEAACAGACGLGEGRPELVERARQFGAHAGMAFQVIDDILDFTGTAAELGKPIGNDVREGTITLPLILALEANPGIAAAVARVRDGGPVEPVVEAVLASGAIDRCRALAAAESKAAVACLVEFSDAPERQQLERLALELVDRRA